MKRRMTAALAALTVLTILTGCGVSYISPEVRKSRGKDVAVREILLTPQTVLIANRQQYTPKSLPAEFYQASGGGNMGLGLGSLPEQPYVPDEQRQELELRLPPPVNPGPYTLGVGDVVLLATKTASSTVEELSGLLAAQSQRQGYSIRDDGTISIPDVGTVNLGGLTLEEAEARIFDALVNASINPSFSLEVAEFNSKRVAVGGAVANTTIVPITLTRLDLGEALAAAGGVAVSDEEFASIRIYRDGTLYQIPFEDYLRRPETRNTTLQAGDAVYVDMTYDLARALQFYEQQIDVITLRQQARSAALQELSTEIGLRRAGLGRAAWKF